LIVSGRGIIGKETIIAKAVDFSIDRHRDIVSDRFIKLDLENVKKLSDVLTAIAKVLNLVN
jgi:hypothetical protein